MEGQREEGRERRERAFAYQYLVVESSDNVISDGVCVCIQQTVKVVHSLTSSEMPDGEGGGGTTRRYEATGRSKRGGRWGGRCNKVNFK